MTRQALDELLNKMLSASLAGDYSKLRELDSGYDALCDEVFPKKERADGSLHPKYERIRGAIVDDREQRKDRWRETLGPYDRRPEVCISSVKGKGGEIISGLVRNLYEETEEQPQEVLSDEKADGESKKRNFLYRALLWVFEDPKKKEPEKKPVEKKLLGTEILVEGAIGFEHYESSGQYFIRVK